jgi:hypothetical protein
MPVDLQGGNSTSYIVKHGGDVLILLPVEDTVFTNKLFGVLLIIYIIIIDYVLNFH